MTATLDDITSFARELRSAGIGVTPDQIAGMCQSITMVDPAEEWQVRAAFRSLTVTGPAQLETFDRVFDSFFHRLRDPRPPAYVPQPMQPKRARPLFASEQVTEPTGEVSTQTGASLVERLAARDFAEMDDEELEMARRLVETMFWKPPVTRTRRWEAHHRGRRPDMRRTLRRSVGPGGDLMPIELRRRRVRQRPLVIIADISGSMERYAEMFLVFAHAARRHLGSVEAFTFSTQLTRITDGLDRRDVRSALEEVGGTVGDWSGGTKIGDALSQWNRQWSRRLARGGPIALVLSDGWDCGDPGLLSREAARLSRSVHRLIWLNPLATHADYRPETRGMKAVLPHIDLLLPAASVRDLADLVALLDSMARPRAVAARPMARRAS